MVPAALADDAAFLETLCRVINGAYELAEAGMWRSSYARTSVTEMSSAVR